MKRSPRSRRRLIGWRAWLPFAGTAAAVAVGTLVPRLPLPHAPLLPMQDKFLHAGAWALLGFAARFGAGRTRWSRPHAVGVAFAVALAYGASIEGLQFFVPGRHAEWLDLAADAVGAAVGAVAMDRWASRRGRKSSVALERSGAAQESSP